MTKPLKYIYEIKLENEVTTTPLVLSSKHQLQVNITSPMTTDNSTLVTIINEEALKVYLWTHYINAIILTHP